jgi:exodeoxyribonuclease-5
MTGPKERASPARREALRGRLPTTAKQIAGADSTPRPNDSGGVGVTLSKQQRAALRAVEHWWRTGGQVFRLFGYAGTGKTTLANVIPGRLGVSEVFYAAYTGKAAYVLRQKGCPASTLHSLIYLPREKERSRLEDLRRRHARENDAAARRDLEEEIEEVEEELRTPGWVLNPKSVLRTAKLLIVDEVSMVSKGMAADILSFGVKVLVLGDPAQLPPVDGTAGYFTRAKPDYLLRKIHRQAKGSPVLSFATEVRTSGRLTPSRVDGSSAYRSLTYDYVKTFDQVIAGTNRKRWYLIDRLRELHGLRGPIPVPGDKVICLENNPGLDVVNGQVFEVVRVSRIWPHFMNLVVVSEDGRERTIPAWTIGFDGPDGEKQLGDMWWQARMSFAAMTFGWAITCHKAQGSQWGSVLVVDESRVFREDAGKWLYTAITRAVDRVAIVKPRRR